MNSGIITIGFGEAEGENRVLEATQKALKKLSLQSSISNIERILLNITASKVPSLREAFSVVSHIVKDTTKDHSDVLPSVTELSGLGEKLRVTIIVTKKNKDSI
ncbi:MAG: hypothetical protein WBG30_09055 [Psychrilyobacter sp.]|uniref:hypothetical protein n=1 Tax=Psychrilyobacter sp. TaxID=2586924 RepID=UPI003C76F8E4